MRVENLHCTLVFIGNIAQYRIEPLQLAAREVNVDRFGVRFDSARYWAHNHIVYAAPAGLPPPLAQLVQGLEHSLSKHGFKFDIRAYRPHVTLLRNAHWSDAPLPALPPVRWQINDYALVQSEVQQSRVDYRVLARFPLRTFAGNAPCGPGSL